MRRIRDALFTGICFVAALWASAHAQTIDGHHADVTDRLAADPNKALFVCEDVHTFLRAHKMLTPGCDAKAILQREYLDKGTPGLEMFIEKYGLTAEKLARAIRKQPAKYASLGDMPGLLAAQAQTLRKAFAKLKRIIPKTVFPPTYFLISDYRGIASGSTEGQLISIEKWNRPIDDKTTLVIHELVHFQQVLAVGYEKYKALFGQEKSLLGLCIREGTAEFFAHLVTGKITQDEAVGFTKDNEKRLWKRFQKEMHTRETGDWMWKKPSDPKQPMHVGYVMGSLIVQAYYDNAKDKTKAVREILSVTDYPTFLEKSGYAKRFEE